MKLLDLSLRHIIIFNSVAETLNMCKSAEYMFITQSAVSQAISNIESKFSVRLFLRQNRKLYLTKEGRELYKYTKKATDILNDAQLYLENIKNLETDKISIGVSTTIGNYIFSQIMADFKKECLNVEMDLFIGSSMDVISRLKSSQIEMGLIEWLPLKTNKSIKIKKIIEDKLIFVCSPQHKFAHRKYVNLDEIKGESFIMMDKNSITRQRLNIKLKKIGIEPIVSYEFNNFEAIKNAVSCNLGISILSEIAVRNELYNNMIKKLNIRG
ncbi:MAG: LysR family transcriptional regulator [Proteobacteria bacterium]|nr:LysR family transcriptional regulator [Pseudomonadota bacterium]